MVQTDVVEFIFKTQNKSAKTTSQKGNKDLINIVKEFFQNLKQDCNLPVPRIVCALAHWTAIDPLEGMDGFSDFCSRVQSFLIPKFSYCWGGVGVFSNSCSWIQIYPNPKFPYLAGGGGGVLPVLTVCITGSLHAQNNQLGRIVVRGSRFWTFYGWVRNCLNPKFPYFDWVEQAGFSTFVHESKTD